MEMEPETLTSCFSGSFQPHILISFSAAAIFEHTAVNGPALVMVVSQMSDSSLASLGLA